MLSSINFENTFISIFLDILDIEVNINIQIYLVFKEKHEEFTVIRINFSIIKRDKEEHLYNEDDLYLESNNVRYNSIIQMNYIYNYYVFYLKFKTTNNFFFRIIFKFIKKVYREKEMRHWIFTIKTTIYRTFILSFEYLPIYIKEGAILKRC